MHPVLFRIAGIAIWTHAVFVAAGVIVALIISWRIAQVHDRDTPQLIWIIAAGLIGGALLARFGLAVRYAQDVADPTFSGFLRYGGRSLLGGLAGAYIGVIVMKRLIGYRAHTGDLLAPGVALGIAIGRVGCHLAETPGTATTLPWGVHVPVSLAAPLTNCAACRTGEAMHPSFVYESLFLALAAWWLYPRAAKQQYPWTWMRDGDLFKLFLLAYAVFRFGVEFVRGNPVMAWGLTGSQLMVLSAMPWLAWHVIHRMRTTPRMALSTSHTGSP